MRLADPGIRAEGNLCAFWRLASQKGRIGQDHLVRSLAVQAQLAGAGPVVLIDIDPQGSLADWWNEREAEYPAFAQTTVARLASDLEVLRQQGFRLAVIDTPPAITMAIQSVIAVAELIVIPTRPSPHDLRAVGATVDLCERAGKPLIFVVNGATPKAKITYEAAVALSQHGTVAPVTLHHRTDFAASMIDGRTVMEVDPKGRSANEVTRTVVLCVRPARKEFPPHRVQFADGRPLPQCASSCRWLRPPRRRPVREEYHGRTKATRIALLDAARAQGSGKTCHASAGFRELRQPVQRP
jgi:chromosome partitioning protein